MWEYLQALSQGAAFSEFVEEYDEVADGHSNTWSCPGAVMGHYAERDVLNREWTVFVNV
jgi:hypothetical protein